MSPHPSAALVWILDVLAQHDVAYKITGGLAARLHGVDRSLADIDIDIARNDFESIRADIVPYLIFGPAEFQDEHWRLYLATLSYGGQEIDICSAVAELRISGTTEWTEYVSRLDDYDTKECNGRIVRVETIPNLIRYKSILQREVDIEDIRQLKVGQV